MTKVGDIIHFTIDYARMKRRYGPHKVLSLFRGPYNILYANYSASPDNEKYQGTIQVKRLDKQ